MPSVGLANFVYEAGLCLVLVLPFHLGGSLHLRAPKLVPKLVTHNREYAMARTITAIYL